MIERAIDGSAIDRTKFRAAVTELCDALEAIDADGWYSVIEVVRPWSRHNPHMTGEFARPRTIRWYLERELGALLELGATITVRASRPATPLDDPALLRALDEVAWEMRAKKLFLFAPSAWRCRWSDSRTIAVLRPSPSSATCSSRTTPCTSRSSEPGSRMPKARSTPTCRCRPGTTARPTRTECRSSTSGSVRRTPRRSPTTSPCSGPTRC